MNKLTQSNTCPICDDIGLIPVIEFIDDHTPTKAHSLACKCAIGKLYEKHYGSYFDHFENFQFEWDKNKHDKYCQCVDENYLELLKENVSVPCEKMEAE